MNFDFPLVVPEPGMVVEFYQRQGRFDFLVGFCRGLIFTGNYVVFVQGFRQASDPSMTTYWAEAHDHGTRRGSGLVAGFIPEDEWMRLARPERERP